MTQANLSSVKDRIRALMNKTTASGCTEPEAISAMQMASKLLAQYNLSMTDVELEKERSNIKERKHFYQTKVEYVSGTLLMQIAKFCDCKVWYANNWKRVQTKSGLKQGKARLSNERDGCYFLGFDPDMDMAEYLLEMLNATIKSEIDRFKKTFEYYQSTARKSASTSFEHGINQRLGQRLAMMIAERKAEQTSGSTALVVVKNQIVEAEYAKARIKHGLKTTTVARVTNDRAAFEAGRSAGDRVNLSRPISTDYTNNVRIG